MLLREATADDIDAVLDVQENGSVLALASLFPQDRHPFPRASLRRAHLEEIAGNDVHWYVACSDDTDVVGFAAVRDRQLLHFGTAPPTWGTGVAAELLDSVVDRMPMGDLTLWVFAANARARAFYAKHRWLPTGRRRRSGFPPHPILLEYTTTRS